MLKCAMASLSGPYGDVRIVSNLPLRTHQEQQTKIQLNSRFLLARRGTRSIRLEEFSNCRRSRLQFRRAATATAAKKNGDVKLFDSEEDLAVSLAKYTADLSSKVCDGRDSFTVVLSGGSLVKSLRKMIEPPLLESVDWAKWRVFWVDERVVPKDHPDSNYLLAYNEFLSKVPIPAENIYAINDTLSAEGAADDYERIVKDLVKTKVISQSETSIFPKFDLILLGMGPDGHIASLFPGHPLLQETEKWITFVKDSPKPPPERITFTFPVINAAANVALVVTGSGKANAVHSALGYSPDPDLLPVNPDLLPVQLVMPEGEMSWFLDNAAASKL